MRTGYTTGTSATAAAVAAAIRAASGTLCERCDVYLPDGSTATLPILWTDDTTAAVVKDGGDDIDATHGLLICASVRLNNTGTITITAEKGIGRVTRPGLQIPVGEYAINPAPRRMITENLLRILPQGTGAVVTLSVPDGEEAAKRTFNARLGIEGGISIIGTSGIVHPMSVEAITATIACEIDVCAAEQVSRPYLVPGKIGENALLALGEFRTVQMSNFVGFSLEYLRTKGYSKIGIAGHPGKLAKLPMGYFDTHSKNSPQATDFVARLFHLHGDWNTVDEVCAVATPEQCNQLAKLIATAVAERYQFESVHILLFNMQGERIGEYL